MSYPASSTAKFKVKFRELHEQAAEFHACLAQHWQCCCSESHVVGIAARAKVFASSSNLSNEYFNMLFEHKMGKKQVKIQIEDSNVRTTSLKTARNYTTPLLNIEATSQVQDHLRQKEYYNSLSNATKRRSVSAVVFPSIMLASSSTSGAPSKSILSQPSRRLRKSRGQLFGSEDDDPATPSPPELSMANQGSALNQGSPLSASSTVLTEAPSHGLISKRQVEKKWR